MNESILSFTISRPLARPAAPPQRSANGTATHPLQLVDRHPQGEQYYVLEGSLEDGGRSYGAGTFVHHAPDSVHRPISAEGCLLLVTLPHPIEDIAP